MRDQNIEKTKMNSLRILSVFLFVSVNGITRVIASSESSKEESPQVPMIEDCAYVDAHYVTCWWKRPPDDDKTIYRLGHLSSSYHPDENDEKYCTHVYSRVTGDGDQIEECGIEKASLYQSFTFWVEIVNVVEDKYYPSGVKSQEVSFTALASTVKLTVPPHSLNIEQDGQLLTWLNPEKDGSLLIYVTLQRDLFYKVECRKHSIEIEEEWKECYRGYDHEARLSHLLPGVSYDLRVFASFDFVFPINDESEDDREWSQPSGVLVYAVPAPSEAIDETTTDNGSVKDLAIVTAVMFIVVVVGIFCGYLLYWKGVCCFVVKFIKPKPLIDIHAKSEEAGANESLMNDNSNRTEEIIDPVDDEADWPVGHLRQNKGDTFTITLPNEIAEDDLKIHITRSFNPEYPRYSSQDDIYSKSSGVDEILMDMLGKQKQKFQSKKSLDEDSIQYMKVVVNDAGIPTYSLTDSDDKSELYGSQGSLDTEYVMEYTAVVPTVTPFLSYSLVDMPETGCDHSKGSQLSEILWRSGESAKEFPHGVIPDYVMQASISYEDFASTMTSFLHTLTNAEHQKESTVELNEHQRCSAERSSNSSLRSHLTNHNMKMSLDEGHCDDRIEIYDSEDEYTSSGKRDLKTNEVSTSKTKATLSRSGSGSLPSIDSGYSAETAEVIFP